jgi:hypothetical protein
MQTSGLAGMGAWGHKVGSHAHRCRILKAGRDLQILPTLRQVEAGGLGACGFHVHGNFSAVQSPISGMLSYTFSRGPWAMPRLLRGMALCAKSLLGARIAPPPCGSCWSVEGPGSLFLGLQTLEYRMSTWREGADPGRAQHLSLYQGSAQSHLPCPMVASFT